MNLVIYTEAQDKTASAVVSMTDTTPLTELEQLVLGDTPTISVTFTDGSAAPAWAGQAGYTMSLALGTPDGDGRLDYTQIQAETAITGGWEGNLPLDTPALVTALNLLVNQGATILRPPTQRYTYQAPRFAWFVLQIAVRGPDGYLTTYASLRVCVLNRVITSNFTEQQSPDAEVFAWLTGQLDAKANIASPTFTGIPAAPTAAADTDTTQIATTAFVLGQASDATPLINGTAAAGTSEKYARGNHVHPTDTSRAPLASPTFTGTPAAPTAAVDTSTTQIATTAYVTGQGYLKSATAATTYQPLDAELTAISGLAANGIVTRTSSSTAAARTITGTAGQVTVTNGDGVSGNPTLSLPTALTSINSITAAAATDLTLSGGTSGAAGASMTLGFGSSGIGTISTGNDYSFTTVRTSGVNNAIARGLMVRHTTTLDMVDSFGAAMTFAIQDNAGVSNPIADVAAIRVGADNTGGLVFRNYTAGTAAEVARISATNGNLLIGGTTDISGTGGLKVFGTTAATNTTSGALQVVGGISSQNAIHAPTAATGTNTTQLATTAFVNNAAAVVVNPRAPRQALAFDGTGFVTGSGVPAYGTGDFSIHFPSVIFSTLTGTQWIIAPLTAVSAFGLKHVAGSGLLASNITVSDLTASTATFSAGIGYGITYVRASGIGTYYVNGVASGTTTDAQNYANTSLSIGAAASANYFSGVLIAPYQLNRALTAAEVLALYQEGAPRASDYWTGGIVDGILAGGGVAADSSFASDTGFWTKEGGATISGGAANFSGATSRVRRNLLLLQGRTYRATFVVTNYVSGTIELIDGNGTQWGTATANGTYTFTRTQTFTTGGQGVLIGLTSGGGSASVDSLTITPLGLLCAPDAAQPGAGLQWLDASGNRAHLILPTSGVRLALPNVSGQIVIEATTTTSGNQQLGGASLVDTGKQWRIDSWTINCSTGTPTVSLGSASAGTQYKAAGALAAGNNDVTLVTRFPGTANLWCNSDSTATLIHRITLSQAN